MFLNEASMLPCVADFLADSLRSSGATWVLLGQHRAESRIPDLVLARVDFDALEERLSGRQSRMLTRSEIALTRCLRTDRPTALETAAKRVFMAPASAMRILRQLEEAGYVSRARSGGYVRSFPLRPIARQYISVEAKRSDWRRALTQAVAHTSFATRCYVAFDAAYSTRFLKARRSFETSGIGLLGIDATPDRCCEVLAAASHRTDHISRALADERLLGALRQDVATVLPETRLPNAVAPIEDQVTPRLLGAAGRSLERLLLGRLQPAMG